MKYSNDFWVIYDKAQNNLHQDTEYTRLDAELAVLAQSIEDSATLDKLMQILDMQSTMLAHEIWKTRSL